MRKAVVSRARKKSVRRKPIKITEHFLQKSFFEWLSVKYPRIRKVSFCIPNGACRSARQGKHFKEEGLTAGVPDIFISYPNTSHHGLYIEFKVGKNTVTEEQRNMMLYLTATGYKCCVCYTIDSAIESLENYLNNVKS